MEPSEVMIASQFRLGLIEFPLCLFQCGTCVGNLLPRLLATTGGGVEEVAGSHSSIISISVFCQ